MSDKKVKYNDNDRLIVATLKGHSEGMTIAEVNEATDGKLVPAQFTNAVKKGLITVLGKKDVMRPAKRAVATYTYVTSDALTGEDGKAYNYTDNEKAILEAASTMSGAFTLSDLSETYGKKLVSGNINGLTKKGNLRNEGKIVKIVYAPDQVNLYGYVMDVPAEDAE